MAQRRHRAAVFPNLADLVEVDESGSTGVDGEQDWYAGEGNETVALATPMPARLDEWVGHPHSERVGSITCGGEFAAATGHDPSQVHRGKHLRE